MTLHPQYITNPTGKTVAVILPLKDYQKLLDEIDELECIKAYDCAKERKLEFLPAEDVFKSIEKKRKKH